LRLFLLGTIVLFAQESLHTSKRNKKDKTTDGIIISDIRKIELAKHKKEKSEKI